MRCLALVVVAALSSGSCAHVTFPELPPPNAPEQTRRGAHEHLKPMFAYGAEPSVDTFDGLLLNNGQRVRHPEDLVLLVPANSATARAIEASQRVMRKLTIVGAITAVVFASFTSVLIYGTATLNAGVQGVGGVGMVLSSLPSLLLGEWRRTYELERASAFVTYPDDLKRRLAVDDAAGPATPSTPPSVQWLPRDAVLEALR